METTLKLKQLKWTFVLLTLLIILLQFYALTLKLPFNMAYSNKLVGFFSIYLNKLTQSFSLWPPLIGFVLAHVFIQSLLATLIFFVIKEVVKISPILRHNLYALGVFFWLICQTTIFLWNGYLFPYSFFATNLLKLINHPVVYLALLSCCTIFIAVILGIATYRLFRYKRRVFLITTLLFISLGAFSYQKYLSLPAFKSHKAPNIIIIITDSLRPDYAKGKEEKPGGPIHVQSLINNSAFFSNSLALLGRSTPGLVSILTGDYPKTNGARFNLIPQKFLNLDHSLTKILKSHGYQTIFAADGRQFINLNKNFDFDQIISAKSGIYDFIFSSINDTPASNLLMNTALGRVLFPYNYGNRNSYYTYLPKSFVHLVDHKLYDAAPLKPTLLIVALTVAHWPYVWARQPHYDNISERYEDSVLQLDKQYDALYKVLSKKGLLENSIIVTLSDHGDSLGLPGDRIISEQNYQGPKDRLALISSFPYMLKGGSKGQLLGMDTSAGHGTDLLSMTQLQTTLAFYDTKQIKPQTITQRVALIDVAPTLLDLVHINLSHPVAGISLKPRMLHNSRLTEFNRPIFLESEIDIPLIDVTKKDSHATVNRLINQYTSLYDIDITTQQLVLKDDAVSRLLQEKQRGIIDGEWLLVYFPGKNRLQTYIVSPNTDLKECYYFYPAEESKGQVSKLFCYRFAPTVPYYVLINLRSQKWQIFFTGEAKENPVFNSMRQKLKAFYGDELKDSFN